MNPRMRFGLSSCWPVGFDGGPAGFWSEEFVLELVCCAASASVATFGAGASGFPFRDALTSEVVVSVAAAAELSDSRPSIVPNALNVILTRLAVWACSSFWACSSSWACDPARAGDTVASNVTAQNIAKTASLNFRRSIYPRGDLKQSLSRTHADLSASHQHIVVLGGRKNARADLIRLSMP
jgi:hypothetical protein